MNGSEYTVETVHLLLEHDTNPNITSDGWCV